MEEAKTSFDLAHARLEFEKIKEKVKLEAMNHLDEELPKLVQLVKNAVV